MTSVPGPQDAGEDKSHGVDSRGHLWRARVMRHGRAFAGALPEAVMAALFAAVALAPFLPPGLVSALARYEGELMFALMAEGGFLFLQATVTDLATRLRKRLPWWAMIAVVGGLVFFTGTFKIIHDAWAAGGWVILFPLLLSMFERVSIISYIPPRPDIEKIAARALVANRINAAILCLALFAGIVIASIMNPDLMDRVSAAAPIEPLALAGALYFATAAYDELRVRTRRFAKRPTVLFGFDPIHIEYLHPI